MKRSFKKVFLIFGWTIGIIVVLLLLYITAAFCLARISVNADQPISLHHKIDIYLLSNGIHTDLVFPVKTIYKDWSKEVKFAHTQANDTTMQYVAFGWGDKGFYLNTPEWADLKAKTAFEALFYLGTTAMHVSFYKNLVISENCRKITISADTYQKLINYVENSFLRDNTNQIIWIKNRGYSSYDTFYEAAGKYSLFYTCNTWTNEGLKKSGLKSCIWTPFVEGILYHYK